MCTHSPPPKPTQLPLLALRSPSVPADEIYLSRNPPANRAAGGKDCQKADWDTHKDQHRKEVNLVKTQNNWAKGLTVKGGPPFPFATKINGEGDLRKAKEAIRMHGEESSPGPFRRREALLH
jgi:hypothetical protein